MRDAKWDNIKGILIILVVFGHVFYPYKGTGMTEYLVKGIYFFHMPAFIFVSGYFSHVHATLNYKALLKLAICYFIMNTMLMAYDYFVLGHAIKLLVPYYSSWYLLALIVWRVVLQLLHRYNSVAVLGFSLLLAFAAGWQGAIDNTLCLARIIAFFPFFYAGYMYQTAAKAQPVLETGEPEGKTGRPDAASVLSKVMGAAALLGSLAAMYYLIAYHEFKMGHFLMHAYGGYPDMLKRGVIFIIAFAMIAGLVLLATGRNTYIAKLGKNSLTIYLFHRIFVLLYNHFMPDMEYGTAAILCGTVFGIVIYCRNGNPRD